MNLAQVNYLLADTTGALENYQKVLKLDPKRKLVNFQIGLILDQQGKSSEAIEAYGKEIENNPEHPFSHFNLAVLAQKAGRLDEALEEYQKFVTLVPENDERSIKVRKILTKLEKLN